VLVAAKASSRLGYHVENLPSSRSSHDLAFQLAARIAMASAGGAVRTNFRFNGGAFGEDRLNANSPRQSTLSIY
jgi:hypothetical protein